MQKLSGKDFFESFIPTYDLKKQLLTATKEGIVVNPPELGNLPGQGEVTYTSQVQEVLIPYTTREDTTTTTRNAIMSTMSIVNIQKSSKPMTMMARHERPIAMAREEPATSTTKQVTVTTT